MCAADSHDQPFDRHVEEYERWFVEHRDIYHAELAALRQMLPPSPRTTLEVGVGSGLFAAPLGINIGVDISAAMLARAQRRGIEVCQAAAERLPFASASFDVIVMITCVCFFTDVGAAFSEARRLLRPGGSVVVGFINAASQLGREYQQRQRHSRFYRDARFLTCATMEHHLRHAALTPTANCHTLLAGQPAAGRIHNCTDPTAGGFVVIKALKK